MSDSVVEINDSILSDNCEEDKFQKREIHGADSSEPRSTNIHILGSSDIGAFGYRFKGPENFTNHSNAELLNSEILHYIEHRRVSSNRGISKNAKRRSLGNSPGLHEMSKFPLKFNSLSMEMLFSLNLNDWMLRRIPFVSFLILAFSLIFWPLCAFFFKKSGVWNGRYYVSVLFHVAMAITLVLTLAPLMGFLKRFYSMTEKLCYLSLGLTNFIWGCWLVLSCYFLENLPVELSKSDIVTTNEILKALSYVYSILLIAVVDSFMPTRVLRVLTFILLILVTYFGSYSSELQMRISFYNWLSTSRKIDVLERDIAESKSPDKSFTPAEYMLITMRRCIKIANRTIDAAGNMFPEITGSLNHMCKAMKTCMNQLTNSPNLYYIPHSQIYKGLGEEADIVETYISSYFEPPTSSKSLAVMYGLNIKFLASAESKLIRFSDSNQYSVSCDIRFSQYLGTVTKVESNVNLFQLLNDWNFSILGHFKENNQPFISLAHSLLQDFQTRHSVPQTTMLNFLSVVEGLYRNVSYHNSMHGIFVAQKLCCLANFIGLYEHMSPLDRAILVVAGICHDIGHPGKTNSFFVNSGHDIANLFNDKAVLENFHSCLTFKVLKMEECNIFSFLKRADLRQVRRKIIDLILSTDMEDHFESISRFRLKRISHDFNVGDELWNICKMLIKASDLGSTCITWDLSYEWAQRLLCEFYSQGDLEKSLELPVSALCDSTRHRDVPKAQSGFLSLVVAPLYEELSKIPYHPNALKNRPLLRSSELSEPSSVYDFPDLDSRGHLGEDSNQKNQDSDSFHFVELVTGNIDSHHALNLDGLDYDDYGKHPSLTRIPCSNRVYDVCIVQLKKNIERWEQMADLGEALPVDDFANEDVSLDVHLAIHT
ncbi:hypothetical protein MACJ_000961 [Theileria orientalis]|uniref:Phosphodiesterase n=1 Tax=Theileria orientalis TaxID=68886 RepID=A0A976QRT0_THEOR|nr:hypothetical protein MACJ_000961 [Theileria orientalis]